MLTDVLDKKAACNQVFKFVHVQSFRRNDEKSSEWSDPFQRIEVRQEAMRRSLKYQLPAFSGGGGVRAAAPRKSENGRFSPPPPKEHRIIHVHVYALGHRSRRSAISPNMQYKKRLRFLICVETLFIRIYMHSECQLHRIDSWPDFCRQVKECCSLPWKRTHGWISQYLHVPARSRLTGKTLRRAGIHYSYFL